MREAKPDIVVYDQERDRGVVRITESRPLWVKRVRVFGRHYYFGRASAESEALERRWRRSPEGYFVDSAQKIHSTFSVTELAEELDGKWTVRDLETGIFGVGDDLESARTDFEAALREHLEVLERQRALSEDLAAQLDYLRRRLA